MNRRAHPTPAPTTRRTERQTVMTQRLRMSLLAAGAAAALALAACSSSGGKQDEGRHRRRRHRQHPADDGRVHHPLRARRHVLGPGPQGRRGRGQEGQRRAAVPVRPGRSRPGQPGAVGDRQEGRRHRGHAGQARRDEGQRDQGRRRPASRWSRSTAASTPGRAWACSATSARTSGSPAAAAGAEARHRAAPRRPCASSTSRATSAWRRAATASRRPSRQHREALRHGTDMPGVQAAITSKLQQDKAIDRVLTLGAPFALAAVQSVKDASSPAKVGHLRHQQGAGRRDQGRHGAVGRRPAAVPAGLPGRRQPVALQDQRQHASAVAQATLTGPAFIDSDNVAAVEQFATNGKR